MNFNNIEMENSNVGTVKEIKEFQQILDILDSEITNYLNMEDSICGKLHEISKRSNAENTCEPKSGTPESNTVVSQLKISIERLRNINERLEKDERHLNQLV